MGHVSIGVYVLSQHDLDARVSAAFKRGVERGRFEERASMGKEPVALNCKHWGDGVCFQCGSQTQGHEVDALFKCPNFTRR